MEEGKTGVKGDPEALAERFGHDLADLRLIVNDQPRALRSTDLTTKPSELTKMPTSVVAPPTTRSRCQLREGC